MFSSCYGCSTEKVLQFKEIDKNAFLRTIVKSDGATRALLSAKVCTAMNASKTCVICCVHDSCKKAARSCKDSCQILRPATFRSRPQHCFKLLDRNGFVSQSTPQRLLHAERKDLKLVTILFSLEGCNEASKQTAIDISTTMRI